MGSNPRLAGRPVPVDPGPSSRGLSPGHEQARRPPVVHDGVVSTRIAAVTIGAAPRPDLTGSLREALPAVNVVEIGALDELPPGESPPAPGPGAYPLRTIGPGRRTIIAEEAWLAPRVQAAVTRGEALGADLTILLCAGGFASVTARGALLRPFDIAVDRLRAGGARRLGVVVPFDGQVSPSRAKWTAAGFDVDVLAGAPSDAARFAGSPGGPRDAIVLDYVGHPADDVAAAHAAVAEGPGGAPSIPVVDLLVVTVEAAVARMGR